MNAQRVFASVAGQAREAAHSARALKGLAPWLPIAFLGGVDGLLRARAKRHPRAPCLRDPDRSLSYGEVEALTNAAARVWSARGVRKGDTVALMADNRVELIVLQLGLSRLGARSAMINTALRGRSLEHVLKVSGSVSLVSDAELPDSVPLQEILAELERASQAPHPSTRKGKEEVYTYLFTSGTTGLPKAAPIRHLRFLMVGVGVNSFGLWLGQQAGEVIFTPMPLYHASAQMVALGTALVTGNCFAVSPRFSASRYWSEALAVGATVGVYVGELFRYLLSAPPHPDARRHTMHSFTGNGLRADVWRDFQARFGRPRIVEFYGATESNAFLLNRNGKPGSCGRPLFVGPANNLRLVRYDTEREALLRDAKGRLVECQPGEVGELVGRIGLSPLERFDGYLDAQATNDKILIGGFRKRDAWFRSGDLLKRDEEGDFFFVDRIGDTFRWKGENVSTQEVAEALAEGVDAICVYGVEVADCEGRAGMAAVVGDFDPEAFYAAALELPPFARPAFVRLCTALDRTSTMKFQKNRLRDEGFAPQGDPLFVRADAERRYAPLDAARRADLAALRL